MLQSMQPAMLSPLCGKEVVGASRLPKAQGLRNHKARALQAGWTGKTVDRILLLEEQLQRSSSNGKLVTEDRPKPVPL